MGLIMEWVHSSLLKIRISDKANGKKERESNGMDQLNKVSLIKMRIPANKQHRLPNKNTWELEEKLEFHQEKTWKILATMVSHQNRRNYRKSRRSFKTIQRRSKKKIKS